MNTGLGIALMAVGALAELILLKHPTPGERIGAVSKVMAVSAVGAFYVPVEYSHLVLVGYVIAKTGDVAAQGIAWAVDKYRVWRVK